MKLRSRVLAGLVLLGLSGLHANAADEYPTRQIKIIVPFPAGAGPDQVARLLAEAWGLPGAVPTTAAHAR